MTTSTISIEPFEAEYSVKQMGGGEAWYACTVVGVTYEGRFEGGRFVIIVPDDDNGSLYTGTAEKVRRVE